MDSYFGFGEVFRGVSYFPALTCSGGVFPTTTLCCNSCITASLHSQTLTIRVAGHPVRVTVTGNGSPIVLIHGLAGSSAWWVRNIPTLSRTHRVVLLDLPGFGSMRRYAKQFSIAKSADRLAQVFGELGIDQAAVVGHSMGGLIAALFAATYPSKVRRLVLAAPAVGLLHQSTLAFAFPLLQESASMRAGFFPTLIRDTGRAGLITLWKASRELLTTDVKRELADIHVPCLVIAGDRDRLVPVSVAEKLRAAIRNSTLVVLPRAGHVLMYDQADLFNSAVVQFFTN